jgi:hypothetical protein
MDSANVLSMDVLNSHLVIKPSAFEINLME